MEAHAGVGPGVSSLVIEIPGPLPPSPNARLHWKALWSKRAKAKQQAMELTGAAVQAIAWEAPPMAEVEILFIVPDDRPRDLDNAIASVKPWIDGLVAAKALAGDSNHEIASMRFAFRTRRGIRFTQIRVIPYGMTLGF